MGKKPLNLQNTWSLAKNDDTYYVLNKLASVLIAAILAAITLSYKPTVHAYEDDQALLTNTDDTDADHSYSAMYWFLYVFYSFQALDELVELFSVMTKREKGALGLLFEMNYIMGMFLGVYIVVFVFTHEAPVGFEALYSFLHYQVIVFFVAIFAMILITVCFFIIERRATRRVVKKSTIVAETT